MTRAARQNQNAVELVGAIALSQQVGVGSAASPFATGDVGWFRDANDDIWFQDVLGNLSLSGDALASFTAANAIAAGQWVFINGTGLADLARANASSTAPAVGVAPAAIASAAAGNIQTSGIFTTTGLTPGATYYLSASVAGSMTTTAPSASGQFVQPLGVALSATQLLIFDQAWAFPLNQPLVGATITGSVVAGGLTASGSAANDFSGSTGTFLTSTGAVTIGPGAVGISGAVTLSAGVGISGTAGSGALSLGSMTGATALPTGNLSWAGASTKTVSIVSTGAGSSITVTAGAASTWSTSAGALTLDSAAALNLGTSTATSVVAGKAGIGLSLLGMLNQTVGGVLSVSGNAIAPTANLHHVGAGLIKNITVPATITAGATLAIVPDAAYTYDATGNIVVPAGGGTATVNKLMIFTWDGTKWTPSY